MLADLIRPQIQRSPTLRRIVKSDSIQTLIKTQRGARVVRDSTRFVRGQFSRPREACCYQLRSSGALVYVRHRTLDIQILNEIFAQAEYEPPPSIAARLENRRIRVLDLGGNIGLFASFALDRWSVSSLGSYEPDPTNLELLREVRRARADSVWKLHEAAVSNCSGTMRLSINYANSRIADNDEPATEVRVLDLFAEDHSVDLLKMDIESSEWPILADPRLPSLAAAVIVMEWHGRNGPAKPRDAACTMLSKAGYEIVQATEAVENRDGIIWAMRS